MPLTWQTSPFLLLQLLHAPRALYEGWSRASSLPGRGVTRPGPLLPEHTAPAPLGRFSSP